MQPNRSIRRLLLTADTVGGVWNYAVDLARSLGSSGTEVLLASMGPAPTENQRAAIRSLSRVTWVHRTGDLEWMEDPWTDVDAASQWLLDLENDFRPEVIHLNEFSHGSLHWSAPALLVAHSCVFTWWRAVKDEAPPVRLEEYARRVAISVGSVDLLVAPTRAMLRCFQNEHGRAAATQVIPNGRTFRNETAEKKLPLIFSAGRLWDDAKNIRLLNEIAGDLLWPIYVAGDAGEMSFPHLVCLGSLSENKMKNNFSRASVYVAPALYEPFGLAVLEAALSGCALVLADLPSLREIWGEAAIYVHPRDGAAWRQSLNELCGNPDLRERYAAAAYLRAGFFSAQRMADGYARAYAGLLKEKSRSEPLAAGRSSL